MRIFVPKLAVVLALCLCATANAAITGRVVDDDAHPIGGAAIRAYAAESSAGMRARLIAGKLERSVVASTESAQDGSFSVDVNGQSAVDLTIETKDFRQTIATVDGDDLGVITLGRQAGQELRITSDGKPVAGAIVTVGTVVWRSDPKGEVTTFLGPFSVVHRDYAIGTYDAATVNDRSGITEIKLSRGVAVRGRVVDAAGPVAHASISINGWPVAESADDGTFALAHAPSDWQSIIAVRGNEIGELKRGATTFVEIRLGAGAALKGTIHDSMRGAAVAGARMTALGADGTWTTVVSDGRGGFTAAPLRNQQYRLTGLHPAYAIESAVALPDAQVRNLTAQPFTRVRGRVLDDQHHPAAGVLVYSGDRHQRAAFTNRSGEFTLRFASSTKSPSVITASKLGFISGVSKAQIWQPGDTREEVILSVGARFLVRVQVVDQNLQPVMDAEVNAQRVGDGLISMVPCYSENRRDCQHAEADGIVSFHASAGPLELLVRGDDIASKRVSIPMVTATSGLVVVKVDRGLEIRGRVIHADGTPVGGAIVEMKATYQPRNAISATDGTFKLAGVAAGSGSLQAFSSDRGLSSTVVTVNAPASGVTITMPKGVRIQGRVVDRATQKPVNDFTIVLPPRNAASISAEQRIHSDDGRYTLDNVSPGSLEIVVRASGYSQRSRSNIIAEAGKTIGGIDIQLDRAARVVGRVTSASGPVAGVQVIVDFNPLTPNMLRTVTDRDGLYVIDGIAAGDHHIRFEKLGFGAVSKPFVLGDGELDLEVALDAGHELRGRVVDRSGRGISDVSVNAGEANASTDSEGAFVLRGLHDGQYPVVVHKAGYLPADAKLDVPQAQPLTLMLDTGATVSGRITGLPPEQVAQVMVSGDGGDGGRTYTRTNVDARGNFAIRGMPDGRVRIEAWLSSRHAPSKVVTIQNGVAPIVEMNFAEGITVSGRVSKNGVPPPSNGSIVFAPSPQSGDGQPSTSLLSNDGSYEVTGLTAGNYDVHINGPGFGFQTKYTATATERFDVKMGGALLRGRAIDSATGAPLAKVHVLVSDSPGGPVNSDSEGRFSVDGLTDGPHFVNATHQGYAAAALPAVVSNGAIPDVEVRMNPVPATIIHVVDAATGEPVPCAITVYGSKPGDFTTVMPAGVGMSKVWVAPGRYKVGIHAPGYPAGKLIDVTISNGDVKLSIAH
jgi:hypothetical protein